MSDQINFEILKLKNNFKVQSCTQYVIDYIKFVKWWNHQAKNCFLNFKGRKTGIEAASSQTSVKS